MHAGRKNSITDIAGVRAGHADDKTLKSGVTAVLFDHDVIASVHVMGGAPGTRETDLLQPENTVESVDAFVLSGGSSFGLDAASGVQSLLRQQGRGFAIGDQRVPIVPTAIIFDLINGGNKDWGLHSPYRDLGYEAAESASEDCPLGTVGAGTGALTGGSNGGMKGGIGSASTVLTSGVTIAALVTVNALGSPVMADSGHFWASPFEKAAEFGGLGIPVAPISEPDRLDIKYRRQTKPGANTTVGMIITDAVLTKSQAKRLAIAAHDGFARALWPAHTPLDGDLIFAAATGGSGVTPEMNDWIDLSAVASSTISRAIARGVYEATPETHDLFPTWAQKYRTN